MRKRQAVIQAFMPWAGLVIGVVAVVFVHQFGSQGTFDHCATISPGPLLVVALLGTLACVLSALASWRSIRRSGSDARRVIGLISIGCAALFAFAILLAMIAAMVLPPCFQ